MTRSMAARQSLAVAVGEPVEEKRKTLLAEPKTVVVPETPKFHPGLPETPAHIRRRGGRPRKSSTVAAAAVSNIFGASEASRRPSAGGGTRATIRASMARTSGVLSGGGRKRTAAAAATELPGGMGLMSLELDDGKTLDVDLTASPSKLMANLGADAVREMKAKMQAYATQLRSFFKRLRVNNN